MPEEIIDQEESKSFDIERVYDLVLRRHMQFLVPLLIGWLLVWAASWVLPVRYSSTTTILVQQPTVPKNYVDPNINDDVQVRLASLTEQILSRTRLLLIANRLHLYQESRRTLTPDQIVARMRDDIGIDLVRDPQTEAISGFTVSYSAPSPRTAQNVVSELTGLFISENQVTLQQESANTTEFLQKQLADARISLAEQDAKVKAFQATHQGELPSQQASNLQILSGLQAQLQNEEDSLNTAQQQKVYFQSLLEQYQTLRAPSGNADGPPTGLSAVDQQLTKMKAQLADLRVRYTEEYPAVQTLEAEIGTATRQRNQLAAELEARARAAKLHPDDTSASTGLDPTTSSAVLQLRSQLQSTQIDIANRKRDVATLEGRISAYQARLNAEPASEEQLADLTRGYEQSEANYNALLKKVSDSTMATSMEQMQEGERFTVLDPPSLPAKPDSPNRIKLCGVGLACGLLFGLAVAGGLEFLDDRLHSEKEIEKLLPLGIIGEIPEIRTAAEEKHLRRKVFLGWTVAALVLVAIAAGSGFNYLYATGSSLNLHVLTSLRHLVGSLRHV